MTSGAVNHLGVRGPTWPEGREVDARELAQRIIVPDDLPGANDTVRLLKARDKVRESKGGTVRFLARSGAQSYAITETIDWGGCNSTTIEGAGAPGDYDFAPTQIVQTGGVNTPLFAVDIPPGGLPTGGLAMRNLRLNANGIGSRALQGLAFTRCSFDDVWTVGAKETQVFFDAVDGFDCGHGSTSVRLTTDCRNTPTSKGLQIGPGGPSGSDVCLFELFYFRALHQNGIGLDCGASDNVTFVLPIIQRGGGGTADSILLRANTNAGQAAENRVYENLFWRPNANAPIRCQGSTTGNDSWGNRFNLILSASGASYPIFESDASGGWSDTLGQEFFKARDGSVRFHQTDGRLSLGKQSNAVQLNLARADGELLQLINTAAALNEKTWRYSSDGNGSLLEMTRLDNEAFGELSRIVQRDGAAVTKQEYLVGGAAKMTLTPNGMRLALPTSAAGLSAGDLWNSAGTIKIV